MNENSRLTEPESPYIAFLITVMFNRIVDPVAVTVQITQNVRRKCYMDRALKDGHIRKTEIVMRRQSTRHIHRYYQITPEGMRYIADHTQNRFLQTMDLSAAGRLPMLSSYEQTASGRAKLACLSRVLIMCSAAGADIPLCNYTAAAPVEEEDGEGEKCLTRYLKNHLNEESYRSLRLNRNREPEEPYMRFVSKAAVQNLCGPETSDYTRCRFTGILESASKSAVVYHAPEFGMIWPKFYVAAELSCYMAWRRTESITDRSVSEKHAMLVVQNARQFERIYRDTDRSRTKKDGTVETLGAEFEHMYIIPANRTGASLMRTAAVLNEERFIRELAELCERQESVMVRENDSLFPLEREDGTLISFGYLMDLRCMQRLETFARSHPETGLELWCQKWQRDYCLRVMPDNVEVMEKPLEIQI